MRLDHYMPRYDFSERHSLVINAPAERVYKVAHSLNLAKSRIIKFLFGIRYLIGLIAYRLRLRRNATKPAPLGLSFDELLRTTGFIYLEGVPNSEFVIGLIGKFWTPTVGIVKDFEADDFVGFNQGGYAKTAANFYITQNSNGSVTLSTETKVRCLGLRAKLAFSLYWMIVRPFSGLTRHAMLRLIKNQAESINC